MALPQPVLDFLHDSAWRAGHATPKESDDLFELGVLDSFALVDFLLVLEEHCGIKVPDSAVIPDNFRTIETIDRFARQRQGKVQ